MKVKVYPDRCCGSGQCVLAAPAVFDQDDDGIILLLQENPAATAKPEIEEAIAACPTAAIELAED
ncbi:ferredoxin [Saccharopolyspora shandongensis]|uniref:Ferredoxin n=1 Tax=Saccharopolyspora shandongensis TaxID=418495 RepID=A0A1H3S518_9PSEU|nr:ferredoxin [Saccharopolyspora shandongensis]SDZ33032.1 Ferredoxin [Saccharopolyspora shandongensis]